MPDTLTWEEAISDESPQEVSFEDAAGIGGKYEAVAPTFESPISITEQGPVYKSQQAELEKQTALWKPYVPIQAPSLRPVSETYVPELFKQEHIPGTGIQLSEAEKTLGPSIESQKDQAQLEILRKAVDLASQEAQRDLTRAELAKLGETASRAVDFIGAIQRIPTEQGLFGAIGKPLIASGEGLAGVAYGQGLNRIAEDVAAGDLNFPRFRSAVGRLKEEQVGFSPLEQGAVGFANIAPDIAITGVGQLLGVPAPLTFGTLSAARAAAEGASPEQVALAGATGAAAPGAAQIGSKAAATILKNAVYRGLLSPNREIAFKALESLGGQAGFQTFFLGMSLPEIAAMPPEKRWDFIVEQGVKNSVFSLLDIPKFRRGIPSETQLGMYREWSGLGANEARLRLATISRARQSGLNQAAAEAEKGLQQDASRIRANERQIQAAGLEPEVRAAEGRPDLEQPAPGEPGRPAPAPEAAAAQAGQQGILLTSEGRSLQPVLLVKGEPFTGGASHKAIFERLNAATRDPLQKLDILEAFNDDASHAFMDEAGNIHLRKAAGDRYTELTGKKVRDPEVGLTSEEIVAEIQSRAAKPKQPEGLLIKADEPYPEAAKQHLDPDMLNNLEAGLKGLKYPVRIVERANDPNIPFSAARRGQYLGGNYRDKVIELYADNFRDWYRRDLNPEQAERALKVKLAEEAFHIDTPPEAAEPYWNALTRFEQYATQRIYLGKQWRKAMGGGEYSPQDLGFEAIRMRLQRLGRMELSEAAETAGRERWTVQSLDLLSNMVRGMREKVGGEGTEASRIQRQIMDKVLVNIDAARAGLAGQPVAPTEEGQPPGAARREDKLPRELTPDIAQYVKDLQTGPREARTTNRANEMGMKARSIADLDALLTEARRVRAKLAELIQGKRIDEAVNLPIQFPREAIETAVNAGSNSEANLTKIHQRNVVLGERPLDWRNNPEVADWLREHGAEVGIRAELPSGERVPAARRRDKGTPELFLPQLSRGEVAERGGFPLPKPEAVKLSAEAHFADTSEAPSLERFQKEVEGKFGAMNRDAVYYQWQDAMLKHLMSAKGTEVERMMDQLNLRGEVAKALKPGEADPKLGRGRIPDAMELPATKMSLEEIEKFFQQRHWKTKAAYRQKFGPEQRVRYAAIGEIVNKLAEKAGPAPKKPWTRQEIGPEDVSQVAQVVKGAERIVDPDTGTETLTQPEFEHAPVWTTLRPEDLADPAALGQFAVRGARVSGEKVSITSNVMVVRGKDGKIYTLSVWNDGRFGPKITNPEGASLPGRKIDAKLLEDYRPMVVAHLRQPVERFRQVFENQEAFDKHFGDLAIEGTEGIRTSIFAGPQAGAARAQAGTTGAATPPPAEAVPQLPGTQAQMTGARELTLPRFARTSVPRGTLPPPSPRPEPGTMLPGAPQPPPYQPTPMVPSLPYETLPRPTVGRPITEYGKPAPRQPGTEYRAGLLPELSRYAPGAIRRGQRTQESRAMEVLDDFFRNNRRGKELLKSGIQYGDDMESIVRSEVHEFLSGALTYSPRNPVSWFERRAKDYGHDSAVEAAMLRISGMLNRYQPKPEVRQAIDDWIDSKLGKRDKEAVLATLPAAIRRLEEQAELVKRDVIGLVKGAPTKNRIAAALDNVDNAKNNLANQAENHVRIASAQRPGSLAGRAVLEPQWRRGNPKVLAAANVLVESVYDPQRAMWRNIALRQGQKPGDFDIRAIPIFRNQIERGRARAMRHLIDRNPKLRALGRAEMAAYEKFKAELDYAEDNWNDPVLQETAKRLRSSYRAQFDTLQKAGVSVNEYPGFTPHRYDAAIWNGHSYLFNMASGVRKVIGERTLAQRTFDTYYHAFGSDAYLPVTRDSATLLGHYMRKTNGLLFREKWREGLKAMKTGSGEELAADPKNLKGKRLPHKPGYEIVDDGYSGLSVHPDYARLIKQLVSPSHVELWGPSRAALHLSQALKHSILVGDFFHLGRMIYYATAVMGRKAGYNAGWSVLDIAPKDIPEAIAKGIIRQKDADWADTRVALPKGRSMTRRQIVEKFYTEMGSNLGRVQDALYKELLTNLTPTSGPVRRGFVRVIDPSVGRYNRFLFDRLTRGMMAESVVREFERQMKANPKTSPTALMRDISKDVNNFFGNIGRQGWFKSKTFQDISRILFLAPQWVEGLIKKETIGPARLTGITSALGLRQGPTRMGTMGRAMGRAMFFMFGLTQALNLIFRHKPTWENEEKEHKFDAWIPGWGSDEKGFWLSPFGIFNEVTHDVIRLSMSKPTFADAITQIMGNKMQPVTRAALVGFTGVTPLGQKIRTTGGRLREMAKATAPIPISFGKAGQEALHRLAPRLVSPTPQGTVYRQGFGTFGIKIEPAETAVQHTAKRANDFMEREGLTKTTGWTQIQTDEPGYTKLRTAIRNGDDIQARKMLKALRADNRTDKDIADAMKMWRDRGFTGSQKTENQFIQSLNDQEAEDYNRAMEEKLALYEKFMDWWAKQPD